MRKLSVALAAVAFVLATSPAVAQEEVPFTVVSEMELAPEDANAFMEQVGIVAEAAAEIGLDGRFAWNLYRWDNTFWFVGSESTLANMEDQEAMVREFMGTSVEAKVMAAFQAVGSMNILSGNTEVLRVDPELSYQPENPQIGDGAGGAFIVEEWVKGDAIEAWNESVADFMGAAREVGLPYPILVAQDIIGDGNMSFVVLFDTLENFYGKNSFERLLADSPAAAGMAESQAAHSKLIARSVSKHMMRLPAMSYQPGDGN